MNARFNTKFAFALFLATALAGGVGSGLYWWSNRHSASVREARAARAVERAQQLYDAGDYAGADAAYTEACNLYGLVLREDLGRTETLNRFRDLTLSLSTPSASDARSWAMQHLIVCRHVAQTSPDPNARRDFYEHVLRLALESKDVDITYELIRAADNDLTLHPDRTLSKLYRGVGQYYLLTTYAWQAAARQTLFDGAQKDLTQAWRADPADPVAGAHLALLRLREIQALQTPERNGKKAVQLAKEAVDIITQARRAHPRDLELAVAGARVAYAVASLFGPGAPDAQRAVRDALELAKAEKSPPPLCLQALCEVACLALTTPMPAQAGALGHTEGQRAALDLASRAAERQPGTIELGTLANMQAFAQGHAESVRTLERALAVPPRLSVAPRLAFESRKSDLLSLLAREQLNLGLASSGEEKTRLCAAAGETLRSLRLLNRPELEAGILTLEAQQFFLTGRYEQAAGQFDRALRLNPALTSPSLLRAAAQCHALAGNLGSACDLLEAVLKLDGGNAHDHQLLAGHLLRMGAPESAIAGHLAAIKSQGPSGAIPLALTGELALRSGRFWDAAEAYAAADPITYLPKRTEALRAAGRKAEADELVATLLAGGPPAVNRTLLACLALEPGEREKTIQAMERSGLTPSDATQVRAALAKAAAQPAATSRIQPGRLEMPLPPQGVQAMALWEKHDFAAFAKWLEKADPSVADHPDILSCRIELAMLGRDWKAARQLLTHAETLHVHLPFGSAPAVTASITAMQALESGTPSLKDAATELRQVAEDSPASADIWTLLANVLLTDQRASEAADAATYACRLQPHRADRMQLLFQCELQANHAADALRRLRRASENLPFNDDLRELWLTSEEAVGSQTLALQVRTQRMKDVPADLVNALHLAGLETRAGRTDDARTLLLGVAPRTATHPEAALSLCAALGRAGFPDDARDILRHTNLPPGQTAFLLAQLETALAGGAGANAGAQTAAWQTALDLEPTDSRPTSKAYVRYLLDADRTDDAIAFLQALLKGTPPQAPIRPDILAELALALASRQDFGQALALAGELPAPDGALLGAKIALMQKDDAGALRFARQAVALSPDNPDALVALGSALASDPMRQGEARAATQQALALAPAGAAARRLEAMLDAQAGLYPQAIRHLWRNLALNPGDDSSFALLTDVLFQNQADELEHRTIDTGHVENPAYLRTATHAAFDRFQKSRMFGWRMEGQTPVQLATGFETQAVRRSQNPADTLVLLATLARTGRTEAALDLLDRLTPQARPLPALAAARALAISRSIQREDTHAAFTAAFAACRDTDELTECLRLACGAYPPQTALALAREALGSNPAPALRLALGIAAMQANLPEEARDELQAQAATLPALGLDASMQSRWLDTLGEAKDRLGMAKEAAGLHRQAAHLAPQNWVPLDHLANLLLRRPELAANADEALNAAQEGAFLGARAAAMGHISRTELAVIRDGLALATARRGRVAQAIALYQSVLDVCPIPQSHLHLGLLLAQQNRPAEARTHYGAAAELAEAAGQQALAAQARWLEDPDSFKNNLRYAAELVQTQPKDAQPLAETCLALAKRNPPEPALLAECMRLFPQVWPAAKPGENHPQGLLLAQELAQRAVGHAPESAPYRLLLALAQANLGQAEWENTLDLALTRQAASIAPWHPAMPRTLPLPDLGTHAAIRLVPDSPWPLTQESLRPLQTLLATAPKCPPVARVLGMLEQQILGQHAKALAIAADGRSITELRLRAASLSALGDLPQAAGLMGQVVADPRASPADRVRHLGLLRQMNRPEADLRQWANAALAKDPQCFAARELLGDLALEAKDYPAAAALYDGIPPPAAPAAPVKRAMALRELGRAQEAANALESALVKCPTDPWLLEAYLKVELNADLRQSAFLEACKNGLNPDLAAAFAATWDLKSRRELDLPPLEPLKPSEPTLAGEKVPAAPGTAPQKPPEKNGGATPGTHPPAPPTP